VSEVLGYLDSLEKLLTHVEAEQRAEAFRKMRDLVRRAAASGGLSAGTKQSYPKPPVQGGFRVDIEVQAGSACVADSEESA
jgi:hypothetical protein